MNPLGVPNLNRAGNALRAWLGRRLDSPFCCVITLFAATCALTAVWTLLHPEIGVYTDSITYQALAKDYFFHGHFRFDAPFRYKLPPAFPLLLSLTYWAGDRMTVFTLQVILLNMVYFSTLIPLYLLARTMLGRRESSLVLVLFCVLPVAAYGRVLMSETLYLPLATWSLWSMLYCTNRPPRWWHSVAIAVPLCPALLTRMQGLLLLGVLAALVVNAQLADWREGNRRRVLVRAAWQGLLPAAGTLASMVLAWKLLGYSDGTGKGAMYVKLADVTAISPAAMGVFCKLLGENLVILIAGVGVLPALLVVYSMAFLRDRLPRGYAILVWSCLFLHLVVIAYFSYSALSLRDLHRTYSRLFMAVLPPMLPLVVLACRRFPAGNARAGRRIFLLVSLALLAALSIASRRDLLEAMLWVWGCNLESAGLSWFIHVHSMAGLRLFLFVATVALALMFFLRYARSLGIALMLGLLLLLQLQVHAFLDHCYNFQEAYADAQSLRDFCLDYSRHGDTTPVVTDQSIPLRFAEAAVTFWTEADPIDYSKRPGTCYLITRAEIAGRTPFWTHGRLNVYRFQD